MSTTIKNRKESLPETTSTYITEEGKKFLGTDPRVAFFSVLLFFLVQFLINQFPLSLATALVAFFSLRRYLANKPRNFLLHFAQYFGLPKVYYHRCRQKSFIFSQPADGKLE
jgi:hypothetical protein